ncbi:MAG TPA: glycosyltransferase family 1 protein, partial [Chloroflexia bacterium]|nr:glycosyltransferase family 1 protein [Chloroflexia bacterium]
DLHETGIKVYPDDPASLAWGILHTLKHPEWSQARARNAERVVRSQYNWGLIADLTVDTYGRVLEAAKAGDWAYKE